MQITATEAKNRFGYYLGQASALVSAIYAVISGI